METMILDKYEVLEKVGEGGMASVYRGRHRTLGREVAIKVLHPHLSNAERNRQRFEREARAIESLRHDNIVQIFDYSGTGGEGSLGACYIVTEFIHGFTLKSFLDEESLPSEIAASVGQELCNALAYAHAHGIVHRDIKPENVMIRPDGHVKLMDFGIARVLDDSKVTMTGGLVGSPAYMSPEQASDRDVGPPSDQFSLGILLYRAVTGHLPFTGGNPPIILRNILDGNYPDPEDVLPTLDPQLADVIRRALSPRPEDRYPDAAAMGQALTDVLVGAHVPTGPEERARFFADPDTYRIWLHDHLKATLLPEARALIRAGDPARALRIVNRMLYLDEDNPEVRALLDSLHAQERRLPWRALLGGTAVAGTVGVALVLLYTQGAGPGGAVTALTTPAPPSASVSPLVEVTPPEAPAPAPTPRRASPTAAPRPVEKRPRPAQGPRAPGPVASSRSPGLLDLHSDPWAEIRIDGRSTGPDGQSYGNTLRSRPLSLPAGPHKVELVNPRCAPLEVSVEIRSGQVSRESYQLCARLKLTGLGATDEVWLDGRKMGTGASLKDKPLALTWPPDTHALEVRRADGTRFEQVLTDVAHHRTVVVDVAGAAP